MSFFKSIADWLEAEHMTMRVSETEKIGSHIQKVTLRINEQSGIFFPIGSYIQPMIGGCVPRAYSVAEELADGCVIIVSLSGGGTGARFFGSVSVGEILKVYGPFDDFQFHAKTGLPKIFLATGTGVAPFVRMIKNAVEEAAPTSLILGVPEESDIPYYDYFKSLAQGYPNLFKFIPVLSRPDIAWTGAKGYITSQFAGRRHTTTAPLTEFAGCAAEKYLRSSDVYVCGHPLMVAEVQKMISRIGVPKKQILIQKFG